MITNAIKGTSRAKCPIKKCKNNISPQFTQLSQDDFVKTPHYVNLIFEARDNHKSFEKSIRYSPQSKRFSVNLFLNFLFVMVLKNRIDLLILFLFFSVTLSLANSEYW